MISAESIAGLIKEELETGGLFLVEASVRPGNRITVYIDSFRGVTIDECIRISRFIEKNLDRDTEDFELEVSSPGLDKPLRVQAQYEKNIGRYLEIVKYDGLKINGKLVKVMTEKLEIEIPVSVKGNRKKTLQANKVITEIQMNDIKTAKVDISLKN